jgi:hypothetical protein
MTTDTYIDGIVRHLQTGKSVQEIAELLGCGYHAIYDRLYARGASIDAIRAGTRGVRTANEVALLFGVSFWRVKTWIACGALAAKPNGIQAKRGSPHFLITDAALRAFLEDRMLWPCWAVDAIRALASRHRRGKMGAGAGLCDGSPL